MQKKDKSINVAEFKRGGRCVVIKVDGDAVSAVLYEDLRQAYVMDEELLAQDPMVLYHCTDWVLDYSGPQWKTQGMNPADLNLWGTA